MTRHVNVGLPFDRWPKEDRRLWSEVFTGTDRYADRSTAALSVTTRYGRLATYRQWLGFLDVLSPELLDMPPAQRVTPATVEDYVGYLRQNCRETTVAIEIQRLFLVMRTLHPSTDWTWVNRICRRIAREARPMEHPEVHTPELYALGLFLMDSAMEKASHQGITKSCAVRYRDGLLISFLAVAPIRRGALSRLTVDADLAKVNRRWLVKIPAKFTKTRTPQDFQLSERLTGYLDTYLNEIRPAFPGADGHSGLWPYIGRPMTDRMIWRRVIKRTRAGLGVAVSPHRFRNAAATFLTMQDPANAYAARDLLGHKSLDMTQKHYVDRAQSRLAGRSLANILKRFSADRLVTTFNVHKNPEL